MLEAVGTLFQLRWATPAPQFRPLPPHIKRTFVPTPSGDLELLICEPRSRSTLSQSGDGDDDSNHALTPAGSSPPIFFAHGGCGGAGVWIEWMTHLYEKDYQGTMFACSLRNRGASYTVPYLRMVWGVTFDELAQDLATCVRYAKTLPSSNGLDPVLVGHSSGGGLSQYLLAKSLVHARALCLVAAIPHFGSLDVYLNWARHDRWFFLRSLLHLQHPMSPLSTPALVHGAFFCKSFPRAMVEEFMHWMPRYESMRWPSSMVGSLSAWWNGSRHWLDVQAILTNLVPTVTAEPSLKDRVCVMSATEDVLMDVRLGKKQAKEFREGMKQLTGRADAAHSVATGKIEVGSASASTLCATDTSVRSSEKGHTPGITVESANGVRLIVVEGAGHHLQNDLQSECAAEALHAFVTQC